MNITFVSVKERTKEIGTRKAIGARRRTILLQFLVEAVSICLIGGAVGMIFAYTVFLGIRLQMPNFPVRFSPDLVFISMLVSVVTGILSGFIPAWGASRLDPVWRCAMNEFGFAIFDLRFSIGMTEQVIGNLKSKI